MNEWLWGDSLWMVLLACFSLGFKALIENQRVGSGLEREPTQDYITWLLYLLPPPFFFFFFFSLFFFQREPPLFLVQ